MNRREFTKGSPGQIIRIRDDGLVAFVPNDLSDNIALSPEVVQAHEKAVLALGRLGALIPALPQPGLVTSPFLAREAVLSSRIEGTKTEVDQLYLFEADAEAFQRSDAAKEPSVVADATEVRNYLYALRYCFEQLKKRPVHVRLLKESHEILLRDVRGEDKAPGKYRWKQAYVGGATIEGARYVAPPGEKIDALMNAIEKYINRKSAAVPSLIRIAQIHYQFEAIHPFNDGNGRLGRLLISMLLSTYGMLVEPFLYLSAYLERNRDLYNDMLWQISRTGAWNEWFLFFLTGVSTEAEDAALRAKGLLALREEYRGKLQSTRCSAKPIQLLDWLFISPVITVNMAKTHLKMSYGGASKCMDRLVKIGLLDEVGAKKRDRLFIATPIIDKLK